MTNRLEQQAPSAVPISSPARGSPCPESPCCPGTGRCISKRMQTFPVSKLQSVPHPQGGDCCAGRSSESTGMREVSRDFIIFQKTRKKNYINQQNRKFLCIGNMLWSIINKKWWAFSDFKLYTCIRLTNISSAIQHAICSHTALLGESVCCGKSTQQSPVKLPPEAAAISITAALCSFLLLPLVQAYSIWQ